MHRFCLDLENWLGRIHQKPGLFRASASAGGIRALNLVEHQAGVGAAKAEIIAHDGFKVAGIARLPDHFHALNLRVQFGNIGRARHETLFQHKQAMNGFLHPGCTE